MFFDFMDSMLFPFYLREEPERKLVQNDLRIQQTPRRAPFLIDECGMKAERGENVGKRLSVFNQRFIFSIMFDGRRGKEAFLVSENSSMADATQAQDLPAQVQIAARVQNIFFKLLALRNRTARVQTLNQSPVLLSR